MTAHKPCHLDLRQPDGALRETTINGNGSGAIVALQAEKVNQNPTGRTTEPGMVPQIRPQWEISNKKAQASLSPALGAQFNALAMPC